MLLLSISLLVSVLLILVTRTPMRVDGRNVISRFMCGMVRFRFFGFISCEGICNVVSVFVFKNASRHSGYLGG